MIRRLRATIGNVAGRLRGNRPGPNVRRAASAGEGRASGT